MTDTGLADNYKGAFGKRIGFGKRPALLMIDFVEAYFDESCALYAGVEDALASADQQHQDAEEDRAQAVAQVEAHPRLPHVGAPRQHHLDSWFLRQHLLESQGDIQRQLRFGETLCRRSRILPAMSGVDDDARDAQSELTGD